MTDPTDPAAVGAAPASTPDVETTVFDPELAALVRRNAPPAGDPELAALVAGAGAPAAAAPEAAAVTPADPDAPTLAGAIPADEPVEPADEPATSELDVDVEPVHPVAAAVAEAEPPVRKRRWRSLVLRFGVSFLVGLVLAAGIGAGVLYAWDQQYDGRILPGVFVGSANLGGLTRQEAEAQLANAFASLGQGQITLTDPDGKTTNISYTDVGRGPDISALADKALAAGRLPEPLANLIGVPRTALHGVTLDPAVRYDRDKLVAAVDSLAAIVDETAVNARVTVGPGWTFGVAPSHPGRAVDRAALVNALDQQLAALGTPPSIAMTVPMVPLTPAVATASAEAAKAAADRMAADVAVVRGDLKWSIAGKSLRPLISFSTAADGTITPVLNEPGLDPLMKKLAKKVNETAQNAGLKLVNGHVIATGTSHEGRILNAAGMKAAVIHELGARQGGTAAAPVQAVVKAINPKLSAADARKFAGKMKVISSFSVYYFVIINNHFGGNIEAPATKINGTVVPAGTVFDFWKTVGDLHKLPGAGPGNAIEGGKITVTGAFGGGICTTSTTLFNAAFRAGMIPMARKNHNEFIDRYPPGLDATVWIVGNTKQTMSFKNDTAYPIMITRSVRNAGNRRWLTFKIWSVPNHRTATVTNTVIQRGERAVHRTVKDPTKPVGYYFFNNSAVDGAKVWTTVSIYDHGKLHWRKRYFSNYPAVDGVTIVGTRR